MVARVVPVSPFDLVVFGASGDLSRRKLIPALFHRFVIGQMPEGARVIGAARSDMTRDAFQEMCRASVTDHAKANPDQLAQLDAFLASVYYVQVDANGDGGWDELAALMNEQPDHIRAFYLSVAPSLFGAFAQKLSTTGIADAQARIVIEKPLGKDLESAKALNEQLRACFDERQIYRIDHYLGKETVQNLMALRFANALFEPLWNSRHVDHVQITVSESLGVGGRGGYYDQSGAMRDMVQNHLMQLLCLTAMEPPHHFEPDAVRDEKLKVIKALEPMTEEMIRKDTVRGQYRAGQDGGSYLDEVENPDSKTECYVALKMHVANWRWSGTPFYLRTGKRLRTRMSEIAVIFKDTPHSIFPQDSGTHKGNALVIRLQPDEGITLHLTIKDPGPGGMRLTEVPLDMSFADKLDSAAAMPDAYERLIMDVIRGDQTLFMRGDEVEAAWAWTDPIIKSWEHSGQKPSSYDAGSSGPEDALMLMHRDNRRWRELEI